MKFNIDRSDGIVDCTLEDSVTHRCFGPVWDGYEYLVLAINENEHHLISIGFTGEAAFATEYVNVTMVRPCLTVDGFVIGWAEVDPEPLANSVAGDPFLNIVSHWEPVDYGWQNSFHVTAFTHAERVGMGPRFSGHTVDIELN